MCDIQVHQLPTTFVSPSTPKLKNVQLDKLKFTPCYGSINMRTEHTHQRFNIPQHRNLSQNHLISAGLASPSKPRLLFLPHKSSMRHAPPPYLKSHDKWIIATHTSTLMNASLHGLDLLSKPTLIACSHSGRLG